MAPNPTTPLSPDRENAAVPTAEEKWGKLLAAEHALPSGARSLGSPPPDKQEEGPWNVS